MLKEEVEKAVRGLKAGKSLGVEIIPSELLRNWGETNTNSPDSDMPEDLGVKEMAEGVDTVARRTFTKQRQPQAMSELSYGLMSHPSKIMLRVILNRLKIKAEELLAEELAGFRPEQSTVEAIFNTHNREAPVAPARSVPLLHRLQGGV